MAPGIDDEPLEQRDQRVSFALAVGLRWRRLTCRVESDQTGQGADLSSAEPGQQVAHRPSHGQSKVQVDHAVVDQPRDFREGSDVGGGIATRLLARLGEAERTPQPPHVSRCHPGSLCRLRQGAQVRLAGPRHQHVDHQVE